VPKFLFIVTTAAILLCGTASSSSAVANAHPAPSANDAAVALAAAHYARAEGATLARASALVAELRAAKAAGKPATALG
jgi:hypothetical protein